ncbi:MAG: N-6 DNA methylase, partial [Myxococcales bacterium]|nr:N-6 DNA methylase [Myxococcales bacterium]
MTGEALLNTILPAWREKVGPAVGFEWFDRFIAAQRDVIVTLLQKWINKIRAKRAAKAAPPDEWTTARRTKANLAAVKILASKSPDEMTSEDRRTLMAYSGWGGLSIRNVRDKFPEGWSPEKYGLIHEYYTPTRVARSIGDAICGLLGDIGGTDGRVLALEPSAGIGRLVFGVEQAECEGKPPIDWITTEFSRVSAAILPALLPGHDHNHETFEKWLDANGSEYQGRVHLVVSNPPYGERGLAKQQDESEEYEEAMAYMYFLRRGLDILAPNGIGVFLVPAGFLTGKRQRDLREKILKRHHLSAAFRLPSKLFPGAQLVVDLLFFRSRGGELTKVDAEDEFILEGRYFRRYPSHILGVERGVASDEDDQTKEPSGREWYRVDGTFEGLPAFSERAVCESCRITPYSWAIPDTRLREVERKASGETAAIRAALYLGVRVKEFTDALEAKSTRTLDLWADLKLSIEDFVGSRMYRDTGGPRNPHQWSELVSLAEKNEAAEGFLSAFTETGDLAPAIRYRPSVRLVWSGSNADILGQAEFLYRRQRWLDIDALLEFHEAHDGKMSRDEVRAALLANEWYLDPHSGPRNAPENAEFLTPERDYTTGPLWRKYDYAEARASNPQWARQAAVLLEAIDTIEFEDIPDITPRAGWIPTNVLSDWVADTIAPGVRISRDEGVYTANSREYEKLHKDRSIPTEVLWLIGWLTHDTGLFKPVDPEPDDPKEKQKRRPIAVRRAEQAAKWVESFQSWAGASTEQRTRITEAYNRAFQGYIVPNYSKDPLDIARMSGKVKLHPHQAAGARRVLDNRGGLVAYDVGVGKTYTALAVIARARQEGWARRPVVIVPTSLVWKWYDDFGRILPDYRVLVIGQKRIKRQRGEAVKEARMLLEAGSINAEQYERRITTSTSDGIDRQAEKWLAFMGGAYDAVILTHEAMKNVRLNNEEIIDYAEHQSAIQRSVKTTVRRANEQSETKKKLSERQEAVIEHGVARWVAETLKTSKRQDFIPGLYWSDIGIDLLVIDEAADFKNLYMPERREGGKIPEFMGSGGDPSDRAWQLDFRAAGVRRNTGGTGIVLLTATPAKNSPLEYYNLVQYIDPNAWTRLGVDDPEQFIDRYILTESRDVITRTFDVERRQAVVGFSNLDELRTVLLRYGEFKSAEDVDLKLPEPRISQVTVKMDKRQEAKYAKEVARLELLLKDPVGLTLEEEAEIEDVKRQALGIQERLNYVALHADGDEGYRWNTAFGGTETRKVSLVSMSTWLEKGWTVVGALEKGDTEAEMTRELPRPDPHGPKFERCALNIKAQRNCGHIVFMQSVAPHLWFKEVLIEHGIPEDRIAILNAKAVPAAVKRTDLAKAFTGDPETGDEPAYDVIICNSVAYEGLDLQLRTCAIHHLDMPWTPGDLEQRNGRGYRQNNSCPILNIYYYVSEESTDGIRFKKVEGKSTWMSELLRSSKSVINNPAAEAAISAEEMLIRLSRNKEGVRKLIEERDRRKLAAAQAEHRRVATKALHVANERFRAARATLDSGRAQRLREEGESLLAEVRKQDTESWPWAPWAELVREVEAFIPDPPTGPVFESLRVTRPDRVYDNKIEAFEFGRVIRDDGETRITMRGAGGATWRALDGDGVRQLHIKPAHLPGVSTLEWPADDDRLTRENIDRVVAAAFRFGAGTWERLGWRGASDTWIEKWWPVFSKP